VTYHDGLPQYTILKGDFPEKENQLILTRHHRDKRCDPGDRCRPAGDSDHPDRLYLADPVVSGLVVRLNQPGGNITGFATLEATLGGKWLELLSEIAPGLKRAAIMFNPDVGAASPYVPSFETAAQSLKVVPITAPVHSDAEIETTITTLGREPGGGLVVITDPTTAVHRAQIISAVARNNLPVVYTQSAFVRDGGLLSYGPDQIDNFRRATSYVDRILRGEKPGDSIGGTSDIKVCPGGLKSGACEAGVGP
jgi:ABC-type uncharacterized transport system substrate-binding protein